MLELLRTYASHLDHLPAKYEIPDADYFRKRFGPWPRVLEKAGLKVPSPTKLRRQEADQKKRNACRKRAASQKKHGGPEGDRQETTNHTEKSV